MNSRQENRSKLSFTARIITKYSLERFLSICGEKMSKGFLKFCKLISNLILGQIIVSNLTNVYKLNSRINYARLHQIRYKKRTPNTIITQAYHSRCTEIYQVRPESLQTFQPSYTSSKVKNENDAIPKSDFRLWQATYFSTINPINKLTMNNRRLLIAVEFHFVHTVEKDS